MTPEQAKFIIETLETAIDWAEYATPYFQEKHNLAKGKEDVLKAIELLKELKSRTCDNCIHRVFHYRSMDLIIDKCKIREQLHFNGSCDGLKCDRWEQK